MKYDVCIYHANCADGFTAAWIASRAGVPDLVPFNYGDPLAIENYDGKHVLIADFSFPAQTLRNLAQYAASVTVLDHHKSAAEQLAEFGWWERETGSLVDWWVHHNIRAKFDMAKSGAMLAWKHLFPEDPIPTLVRYVQDRDLWKFELHRSHDLNAYISSWPYTLRNWTDLYEDLEYSSLVKMAYAGQAINRKLIKDIGELLQVTSRKMIIGGHLMMVANMPYSMASETGNLLAERAMSWGGTYFDHADGYRQFSLRSIGTFDVSQIAVRVSQRLGTTGGGHRNAAGFKAPLGWEGEEEEE